ncbi:hypothetical protein PoB_002762100 [Plakobranchus ocellatus]|uniref:Uncharacterized protein n=1 Tax=Plakobranchus ocellatus TaxID=259542 RepID=A0AAV3ZYW8_9GAST|nr:hypothetical protein PoB_002762100 [Plakobranchus ocellatus]
MLRSQITLTKYSPTWEKTSAKEVNEQVENGRRVLASPQQGDLRLSGPPSGQGAGGGARTSNRNVSADLRADSLATVPPTSHDATMRCSQYKLHS